MLRERRSKIFRAQELACHEIFFSDKRGSTASEIGIHGTRQAESDVQDTILAKLWANPPIHHIYIYLDLPQAVISARINSD